MAVTEEHLRRAVAIARSYGASRLVLFGSANETPDTARDLDLAVAGMTGWDLFELAAELEEQLHLPLDLVPLDAEDAFVDHIQRQGRVLYDDR
jgi:predicted nucleotidyltransferase